MVVLIHTEALLYQVSSRINILCRLSWILCALMYMLFMYANVTVADNKSTKKVVWTLNSSI